ncbi:MAG: V-type ATP synthase subunit E [Candidatus Diapherotrites archaeon]
MSFEELKKRLLEEAKADASKLVSSAEKEALFLVASAEEKLKKSYSESLKSTKDLAEAQLRDSISGSRLKAKKLVSEAKEIAVENALNDVWLKLCELPKSSQYEGILKKLISEGVSAIGSDAIVVVNGNDFRLAKKFAKNVSQNFANIVGGAIITNSQGNVLVDNSFESLFASKKEALKTLIYAELFGGN